MRRIARVQFVLSVLVLCLLPAVQAVGQSSAESSDRNLKTQHRSSKPEPVATDLHPASAAPTTFLTNLAIDQKAIWSSPFKARIQDLNWIIPLAGLTAGMFNADAELSSRVNSSSTFARHASTVSNAGVALALGGSGGLYLLGKLKNSDRQRETGVLGVEAASDAFLAMEALKLVTQRARPTDGAGTGNFFDSSSIANSSFPSLHSGITWSVASVLAHEYPRPITWLLAYGLATSVSAARVAGKEHFPSDVLVGSAMGWLIGRQVYAAHHNPELADSSWGTFDKDEDEKSGSQRSTFSSYVPLDSWVYPAFDRLIALGVIDSGIQGLRPWTRQECARLLAEASESIDQDSGDEASRLYSALENEFVSEIHAQHQNYLSLNSIYTRFTNISGHPLTDGYHFGQTIVNDFGRPYQEGMNGLGGFSASASSGSLGFFVRGEFEHAPSADGVSQSVQNALQRTDLKPVVQPASAVQPFDQFRLLDTYIALNIKGWQTSFGKQSLWLGPTQDPFLQSSNAEPIYMLRLDQTTPTRLPGFLGYLGPMRSEFWVGKLTGHHYVSTQDPALGIVFALGRTLERQPMVNGVKFNFKPTPNFEFGVGRTGLFGGPDFPITLGSIRHSLFSTTNAVGRGLDPGDRRSTFDFSYRLPGLRSLVTLYDDSFVEDEISPIGYPRRAAHDCGLYFSRLPELPHLDLRVEGMYTNLPGLREPGGGGFFDWNVRYLDGYTNKGNIIGNATVGRQGIALRAQSTYWFASDKTIQLGYRSDIADSMFAQGGNVRDIHVRSEWSFKPSMSLSSFLQYEWWNFPLLTSGKKQNDFTASFQLTYWPHWKLHN